MIDLRQPEGEKKMIRLLSPTGRKELRCPICGGLIGIEKSDRYSFVGGLLFMIVTLALVAVVMKITLECAGYGNM